jgi:hypothetical protein
MSLSMQGVSEKSESDPGESRRGLDLTAQQWIIALLVGVATVSAAGFGWRAAATGSTAAYDDRQSISETIAVKQQEMDIGLAVSGDTRNYSRYLAGYAFAAELENQADGLEQAGDRGAAAAARREAVQLRRSATRRAADAGVFGNSTIADDLSRPSPTPRPFSFEERLRARTAEQQTGVNSPGELNPDRWAKEAEQIRDRINGLAVWAFIALFAVLMFSLAEANSTRRPVFYLAIGAGVAVLLVGVFFGLTVDFFA